ncbi:MAG TPA: molybdopterin converting factor subunit 1 [Chitinophaga sp.]|uniref:molybdopterin converting factor subunit 1 n=1 Tax=Chitinophaga sp. TaxID=1869181 RepID=UPI002BCD0228|nr:molybdopterin converting factor subunit 1 [Chitinophaga sp.]HVI46934.1 molybdopterin converting factor subunit 1 [Chitinophaga sp.]
MSLLLFGVVKDVAGAASISFPDHIKDVATLKRWLYDSYPALKQLKSMMIAVNREYAADGTAISAEDEIAVIPPVSGG